MAEVEYIGAARADLAKLDESVQLRVLKRISLLESNPGQRGKALGGELTGFRSLKVGDRDWGRVVYRVVDPDKAEIVAIGPRDNDEIYQEATRRVRSMPRDIRRPMRNVLTEVAKMDNRPKPKRWRGRRRK